MTDLLKIFRQHAHWAQIRKVLDRLHSSGFKTYLAGGCIRDVLLGKNPKDFDIATSAEPQKVLQLFPKSRVRGKAFGVVAVPLSKGQMVEVATFRKDGPYLDGRRPQSVTFSSEKEDALRRDFTINALFYDVQTDKILDYIEGLEDLKNKIIRTVGEPLRRFQEDKLRIIRALRFSVQLDFQLEAGTQKVLFDHKKELLSISKERIYEECLKILKTGKFSSALNVFKKLDLLEDILGHWDSSNWEMHLKFWKRGVPEEWLRQNDFLWMYAFYPLLMTQPQSVLTPEGQWIHTFAKKLRIWRFPVKSIKSMRDMFYGSYCLLDKAQASLAKKLIILNSLFSKQIIYLSKAYLTSKGASLESLNQIESAFLMRAPEGALPKPLVNGEDLKQLGILEDRNMSIKLAQLYELQLEDQIIDKNRLLKTL